MHTRALQYAAASLACSVVIVAAFALYAHEHRTATAPADTSTTQTLGSSATVVTVVATSTNQQEKLGNTPTPANTAPTKQVTANTISLSIQNLYDKKSVAITKDETLLALLTQQNATDPDMQLQTQEYAGLGALVTSMAGQTNGTDKKYWQYTVNGVEPQIGASGYILKSGDRVEWVFVPSMQ